MRATARCADTHARGRACVATGREKPFPDYSAVSAVKEHNHVSAGLASLASPPHPVRSRLQRIAPQFHLNGAFSSLLLC